jgi:hypothetical protein
MGSTDKRLRYSAALHLLLYFLHDAYRSEAYHDYLKKIDRGVLDDIRRRSAYYDSFRNKTMGKVQRKANDMYLKSNHIRKGIVNYSQVVGLVIMWHGGGRP